MNPDQLQKFPPSVPVWEESSDPPRYSCVKLDHVCMNVCILDSLFKPKNSYEKFNGKAGNPDPYPGDHPDFCNAESEFGSRPVFIFQI
jgi:hypothetical protein